MKTLRAFLLGGALGALVGLILAPQREAIMRAQLAEEQAQRPGAKIGTQTVTARETPGGLADTTPQAARESPAAAAPRGSTGGQYVGNLHTKVYHAATDANLPSEENRTYFGTPEEAEAAGYHAAP